MKTKKNNFKIGYLALGLIILFFHFQGGSSKGFHKKKDYEKNVIQIPKIGQRLQKKLSTLQDFHQPLKVWIYFKDKGITTQSSLEKRFREVRQSLRPRSIWRRLKVRSEENIIDLSDLPLFQPYTERVYPMVYRMRTVSRWLNALSAEIFPSQICTLAELGFVRKIDLVSSFRRKEPLISSSDNQVKKMEKNQDINYGPSYDQLDQINVLPLHHLGYSGKGVLVCMLDTGFRKSHEIFQHANVVAEWDFVNNDNDVSQDVGDQSDYSDSHGTGTWSALGGYKPGELIGPAYGADFILGKTESTLFEQPIEEDYWVAGIEWAEALGAEVVSSSLGYIDWYTFEDLDGETAVTTIASNRAVELGIVVVTAAGNERDTSWDHIIAPADGFGVISVGAVDTSGVISSFSSPGPTYDDRTKPEVCALGVGDWLAGNRSDGSDYYRTGDGTSFATPLVGGVAALLLEIHRDWTPVQVRSALLKTASQSSNPDSDYGWGIANADLAAKINFALPALQSFTLDDDGSGESLGNGNNKAEVGETIEITPTLKNKNNSTISSIEAKLWSTHLDIQIIKSEVNFPTFLPLSSQSSENPFVIKIPVLYIGHHAVFRLKIKGPNNMTSYEDFRISISR